MAIYSAIKRNLPAGLRRRLRRLGSTLSYEAHYERHARFNPPHLSIGTGDYDLIGRIELGVLLMEGLKPGDTLVDLGCGTGRLAVKAIPRLAGGRYIGIDISRTMLAHARASVGQAIPSPPCSVEFRQQTTPRFLLPDRSVDVVCAFSVFTHMEHEDNYRYLRAVRKIIKDNGRFLYSCLPMELSYAREVFEQQASMDPVERWGGVRCITTTRELMDALARMAGWEPIRWYGGEDPSIRLPDTSEARAMGQSVCVLAPS